jgi:pyridoxal phosphate enzyme (YggS family)
MGAMTASSMTVTERIQQIQSQVPDSVRLIAVTKQVSVSLMREAYGAGIRDFGESRVQEAIAKQTELLDLPNITWHLIGHLQTNKAHKALEHFQWIHSVDDLKLAERLNTFAADLASPPNICLQVKILPDPHKFGWLIPELLADLPRLNQYKNLNIQGLMTIPPQNLDRSEILSVFQQARALAIKIQQQAQQQSLLHLQMQHLSMGMSNDYQLAIEAGATMIRLGQILFGQRM